MPSYKYSIGVPPGNLNRSFDSFPWRCATKTVSVPLVVDLIGH